MFEPFLPSSLLEVASSEAFSYGDRLHNNSSLRIGCIIEALPPDSEDNISKLCYEYTVQAIQSSNGQPNSVIYKNVMSSDAWGGIADFFEFQKRIPKDSKKVSRSGSLKDQVGSIVLVLFLDSSSEKGVIIGSLQHPSRKSKLSKDVFAAGALNGIEWLVNADGSFSLVFKGETNADGKQVDTKVGGSNFTIGKDGSIQIGDNSKEAIKIDQTNKTIGISSEKDLSLSTDANINVTAKANGNFNIKDLVIKASGAANLEATGEVSIKSGGNLGVKAASMDIQSDGSVKIKGMEVKIEGTSVSIGAAGGTPAVTMLTKSLGIGFAGTPVISSFIGSFSSSVKIGS